jgi:hypothetical protein
LFRALRQPQPAGAAAALETIDREVQEAIASFSMTNPSASVPALARGLHATRSAVNTLSSAPDAVFILKIKEQQFQDAINAALGVELTALSALPTAPIPGQTFEVLTEFSSRSGGSLRRPTVTIEAAAGWKVTTAGPGTFSITLADTVAISTRPPFTRSSITANRYTLADERGFGRAASAAPAEAVARYEVDGEPVQRREIVRRREPKLPYGDALRELRVVPALSLTLEPSAAIVPTASSPGTITISVDLLNNDVKGIRGALALQLPPNWGSTPPAHDFTFTRAGERRIFAFDVTMPPSAEQDYTIGAVATANGRIYREGYELIDQRDLEVRYLYRPSTATVRGVRVAIPKRLTVGYVMGIGDRVPEGIAQLGHSVTLLSERDLASGNLRRFDAIMTGTRAYAVREELNTYGQRLLEYVNQGGNLVVLYNTVEMVPSRVAPYQAS